MRRHVVLVGLPGAGKSTVGRRVAETLGTTLTDVDRDVERLAGTAIREIFALRGEAAFRTLEREQTLRALEAGPRVIAAGGGWPAQPGAFEAMRARALVVYLYTDPQAAAARTGSSPGRPLLRGDPGRAIAELLAARAPFYERADATISTTGRTPDEVAREVVALARREGGW